MPKLSLVLVLLTGIVVGCAGSEPSPPAPPKKSIEATKLEEAGYKENPDGTYTVASEGVELRYDPKLRTPVLTMRACREWVTACEDDRAISLDVCFDEVPRCTHERPWEVNERCCPETCVAIYHQERQSKEPWHAFQQVAERSDECFPGMREYGAGFKP